MIIGLDFDGTVVVHKYPKIGAELPNCFMVLKQLIANGHKIVLNTMRSGKELQEAVDYMTANGIKLYGVNKTPGQTNWTASPKVYAELYIDDAALGCPLDSNGSVDWNEIENLLILMGII